MTTIPDSLPNLDIHLATFGRDRCNWLPADTWATEHRAPTRDDLCPGPRRWYVEVHLGDRTVLTTVCDSHLRTVQDHPGFLLARRTEWGPNR